jgi:hypoxanthine phosphoribosyltransferase
LKPLYPVKFVDWGEVVDWSWRLAEKIDNSGYIPDIIVAVGRGGFVVSRLLCDFLSIENLLSIPIKWVETVRRPGEKYLAELVRGWVEAVRENKPVIKSVEEVVKRLKTSITFEYHVNISNQKVLLVEEIAATGMHLFTAKEFISRKWEAKDIRTAALVWKTASWTVPSFKPDYHLIEPKGFVWFQFPWSRLSDYKQFLLAMLPELAKSRGPILRIEDIEKEFAVWYGPKNDQTYLRKALEELSKEGFIKFLDKQVIQLNIATLTHP